MEFVHTGECESLLNSVCCNNLYELFVRTPVLWGCSGNFFALFLTSSFSGTYCTSTVCIIFSSLSFLYPFRRCSFCFSSSPVVVRSIDLLVGSLACCTLSGCQVFVSSLPGSPLVLLVRLIVVACLSSVVRCHICFLSLSGIVILGLVRLDIWVHTVDLSLDLLPQHTLGSVLDFLHCSVLFVVLECIYACQKLLTRPVRVCVGSVLVSGRARYTLLSQWSFPSAESGTGVRLWLCDRLAEDTGRLPSRATTLYLTKVLIIC